MRVHGAPSSVCRPARYVVVVLALLLARPSFAAEGEAEPPLEPAEIAAVIRCMVPQARGEGWRHERLRERYYQDEQLLSYGRAIRRAVQLAGLGERYVAVMIGTLYQQSKFQYDAVSRYNVDDDGKLLKPRRDAWRRAQKGMDYGIFQHHWPFIWVPTVPPWNGARKPTLKELKEPTTNIVLAGEWMKRKAETCRLLRKSRSRRPCRRDKKSLSCRCLRTYRATGAWWVNGHPRSIGRIMKRVDQCVAEVRARPESS